MSITLTISALPDGSRTLVGFTQFWLRYVHGFSPHFHCQRSLRGHNDPRFKKGMPLGQNLVLRQPGSYDYIYLCGVTARRYPGLHLALVPDAAAGANALTYNGIAITVMGARQLDIPPLPEGFAGMSRLFTTCVNWQFGVCYYGLDAMRRELIGDGQ